MLREECPYVQHVAKEIEENLRPTKRLVDLTRWPCLFCKKTGAHCPAPRDHWVNEPRPAPKNPRWVRKHYLKMKELKARERWIFVMRIEKNFWTQIWFCHVLCRWTLHYCESAATSVASLRHNVSSMHLSQRWVESTLLDIASVIKLHHLQHFSTTWSDPKAADVMVTHGFTGTLNMSQQIDRMGVSDTRAPCVTPKAFLWNFTEKRPFTGIDKLIFQSFPVQDLHLTSLTEPVASQHLVAKI